MLPEQNTEWPPQTEIGSWWDRLDEWECWFSGDSETLSDFYSERTSFAQHAQRFWANVKQEKQRAVHLPAAHDIAATSASLLFSERAQIDMDEGNDEAWERLEAIMEENRFDATLLEAAEMAAGLGGVYLKVDTDPELIPAPIIVPIKPAAAVPVFRRGRLWEITFWRVVKKTDGAWWYLFEERKNPTGENLVITYKLFKGSEGTVGQPQDLNAIEETQALGLPDSQSFPLKSGIGVIYVPNNLPNRLHPGNPQGMSDYGSCTTLLDSLDEAWTSWMRDIRLGLGRLIIDKEFLTDVDKGEFGHFQETFVALNLGSVRLGAGDKYEPIKDVQFEMRVNEHHLTCTSLFSEIVDRCGYNPQTFGLEIKGQAESGTALRIRERKSMMTRQKKSRYWQWAIKRLLYMLQEYDIAAGTAPSRYEPTEVTVELQDSVTPDAKEISETIVNLRNAQAMSQEIAVRMANPDWTDDQVMEELARLEEETSAQQVQPVFPGEEESAFGGQGEEEEEG